MKKKVTGKDYNAGKKRVNVSMNISDYEDLLLISAHRGIDSPGTVALSILTQEVRFIAKDLRKTGFNPGQQHLFEATRIKTKGKNVH